MKGSVCNRRGGRDRRRERGGFSQNDGGQAAGGCKNTQSLGSGGIDRSIGRSRCRGVRIGSQLRGDPPQAIAGQRSKRDHDKDQSSARPSRFDFKHDDG